MLTWWLWESAALLGMGAGLLAGMTLAWGYERRAMAGVDASATVVPAVSAGGEITIEAAPIERITVHLVGHDYEIVPPKAALGMKMATAAREAADDPSKVFDVLMTWVDRAFGKSAREIRKRLDSSDDALDLPHVMALMEAVMERQTGNPTSSSSDT